MSSYHLHFSFFSFLYLADKYRLYKKLSKSAPFPSTSTSDPPSTPPKERASSRVPQLLRSNPRILETTAPLSSFNPFSPQKNKGKQKEVPVLSSKSSSNPFASPLKAKSKSDTQSSQPTSATHVPKPPSSSLLPTPSPAHAISRARKRLRGEPVSPSPNKDKRRRVGSQSTLSLLPESSSNDDDDDEMNLSFVTDSPMKAPAAGTKTFKLLFDDTKTRPRNNSLTSTKSISQGLFGARSSSLHSDEELDWDLDENSGTRIKAKVTTNGKRSTKHIPTIQAQKSTKTTASITTPSEMRTSTKRSQPDTDAEYEVGDMSNEPPTKGPSLLPPSPPGPDSYAYYTKQANKKSKPNTTTRKKPKVINKQDELEDGEDDASDDFNTSVKIVNRTQPRFERGPNAAGGEDDLDYDSDPILGRAAPRGYLSSLVVETDAEQGGQFEVDLPDKLRQVLALESSKTDSQTESVVKRLLYGRRVGNYDPVKGGEIWDVGEDDGRRGGEEDAWRDTDGEDDWEGEPIPWEVGEL